MLVFWDGAPSSYKWYQSHAPKLVVCVGVVRSPQGAKGTVYPCKASRALEVGNIAPTSCKACRHQRGEKELLAAILLHVRRELTNALKKISISMEHMSFKCEYGLPGVKMS